jgi:hypothetical protein
MPVFQIVCPVRVPRVRKQHDGMTRNSCFGAHNIRSRLVSRVHLALQRSKKFVGRG